MRILRISLNAKLQGLIAKISKPNGNIDLPLLPTVTNNATGKALTTLLKVRKKEDEKALSILNCIPKPKK